MTSATVTKGSLGRYVIPKKDPATPSNRNKEPNIDGNKEKQSTLKCNEKENYKILNENKICAGKKDKNER